jgi:hypothetical protein
VLPAVQSQNGGFWQAYFAFAVYVARWQRDEVHEKRTEQKAGEFSAECQPIPSWFRFLQSVWNAALVNASCF